MPAAPPLRAVRRVTWCHFLDRGLLLLALIPLQALDRVAQDVVMV